MTDPSTLRRLEEIRARHEADDGAATLMRSHWHAVHTDRAFLLSLLSQAQVGPGREEIARTVRAYMRSVPENPRSAELRHLSDECADAILSLPRAAGEERKPTTTKEEG